MPEPENADAIEAALARVREKHARAATDPGQITRRRACQTHGVVRGVRMADANICIGGICAMARALYTL